MGIFYKILGAFTNRFLVGRGRAEDVSILAWLAGTQKPGIRFNYNEGKWQYSNDSITWLDMGTGSAPVVPEGKGFAQWFIPPAKRIEVGEYQQYVLHTNRFVVAGSLSLAAGAQLIVGVAGVDTEFRQMLVED
jgi:hypothetical protein